MSRSVGLVDPDLHVIARTKFGEFSRRIERVGDPVRAVENCLSDSDALHNIVILNGLIEPEARDPLLDVAATHPLTSTRACAARRLFDLGFTNDAVQALNDILQLPDLSLSDALASLEKVHALGLAALPAAEGVMSLLGGTSERKGFPELRERLRYLADRFSDALRIREFTDPLVLAVVAEGDALTTSRVCAARRLYELGHYEKSAEAWSVVLQLGDLHRDDAVQALEDLHAMGEKAMPAAPGVGYLLGNSSGEAPFPDLFPTAQGMIDRMQRFKNLRYAERFGGLKMPGADPATYTFGKRGE